MCGKCVLLDPLPHANWSTTIPGAPIFSLHRDARGTFKHLNMVNKVRVESIVNGVEWNMRMETPAVPSVLAGNTSHAEASETCN